MELRGSLHVDGVFMSEPVNNPSAFSEALDAEFKRLHDDRIRDFDRNLFAYGHLRPPSGIGENPMIVKKKDGYYVVSEKGKNLGGPYKSRGEAEKRLRQVEFFKNRKEK